MKVHKDFTDDISGVIVGGEYGTCWVTYDGRKQGGTKYPSNEIEALNFCAAIKKEIMDSCGGVFKTIYPLNAWKFHFDGV